MRQIFKNCDDLTICNQADLMHKTIFITKDVYKVNCSKDCISKSTCGSIIDLLRSWNHETAQTILNKRNEDLQNNTD